MPLNRHFQETFSNNNGKIVRVKCENRTSEKRRQVSEKNPEHLRPKERLSRNCGPFPSVRNFLAPSEQLVIYRRMSLGAPVI